MAAGKSVADGVGAGMVFYCWHCSRNFKSLSHFNRFHARSLGLCSPVVFEGGKKSKRQAVKNSDGVWVVEGAPGSHRSSIR